MGTDAGTVQGHAVGQSAELLGRICLPGERIALPGFNYSQTLEDGDGVVSY